MTSQQIQTLPVDADLSLPTIELQSFEARNEYSNIRSDDDPATPLAPSGSREPLVAETSTRYPDRRKSILLKLRDAVTKPDKWNYVRLNSYFPKSGRLANQSRGWRRAVMTATIVSGIVLLINTIFTVVLVAKEGAPDGLGVIYTGDCGLVERWNTALHLLINVLGTCLLAASSFTMQCLSSPTRSETDAAHVRRRDLDIGIVSFKNLFYMNWLKGLLWWALVLSTLPLHLFYNSTVFSTSGANTFAYVIVNEAFLRGAPYDTFNSTACEITSTKCNIYSQAMCEPVPTIDSIYDAYVAGNYSDNMTVQACVDAYSSTRVNGRRNIIAVTKATEGMRMAPACAFAPEQVDHYVYRQPLWNGSSVLGFSYIGNNMHQAWLCNGYDSFPHDGSVDCNGTHAQSLLSDNGTLYLRPEDMSASIDIPAKQSYPIEYCLSEAAEGQCQLQFVSYLLFAVIACNLIKVFCMASATRLLWDLNEPIFATVGDAVTSYLEHPDETTKGWCIMDSAEVAGWRRSKPGDNLQRDHYDRPAIKKLFFATSMTRWCTTMLICVLYLTLGIVLLRLSVSSLSPVLGSNIWNQGFGASNSDALLNIQGTTSRGLLIGILTANSFQLALSTTYFLYNSLYTAQCTALEWSSYAAGECRPLRVTWPHGEQRSTYYLQLPYRYGLPLTIFLMVMHFLISQSIFLVRLQYFDVNGNPDRDNVGNISDVGFSPLAILVTLCVGGALILAQILHALRPLDNRIPIHGNSSVVISALCHSSSEIAQSSPGVSDSRKNENIAFQKVIWGAVVQPKDEFEIGHCSFSGLAAEQPIKERRYH